MLEETITKLKKHYLVGIVLSGLAMGCSVQTKDFTKVTNSQTRKQIAKENLIYLFLDRKLIREPVEKYFTADRIKVNCQYIRQTKRPGYFIFNCDLLESVKGECGFSSAQLTLELKTGEVCFYSLEYFILSLDECSWVREVERNLREYCSLPKAEK